MQLEQIRSHFADIPFLLEYVTRCGEKLAPILKGIESPLETLFPGGSYDTAESLYRDWAIARYFNAILGAAVEAFNGSGGSDRIVSIVEIGAGTGGTTESLLPLLGEGIEYVFTDVSEFFSNRAREKFRRFPFLQTALLDIEKPPDEQNLPAHSFQVVVASNVLHATRDLDRTMKHVRRLMAPGGVLLLYETTEHPKWFDITTGLIEGWQRFDDSYRTSVPLISAEQWRYVLDKNGFKDIHTFPEKNAYDDVFFQHAIIARTDPGETCQTETVLPSQPKKQEPAGQDDDVAGDTSAHAGAFFDRLTAMADDERREECRVYVSRQVATVMHKAQGTVFNINDRLLDLGVDSLMALELRNRLAQDLQVDQGAIPATLVFDYPSIASISDYLLEITGLSDSGHSHDGEVKSFSPGLKTGVESEGRGSDEDPPGDDIKRSLIDKLNSLDEADLTEGAE